MIRQRSTVFVSSLALVAASSAAAQTKQDPSLRRGMASIWAAGISVKDHAVGQSGIQDPVLFKPPGDQTTPPGEWARIALTSPDYSMSAMFPSSRYLDSNGQNVDVAEFMEWGGHSAGAMNAPHFDSNGEAIFDQNNQWMSIAVSVVENAATNQNSYLASVPNTGSEILSYYLEGSTNIHTSLPGSTLIEQRSSDFGFPAIDPPDVDGLDYAIGSFTVDPNSPRNRVLFPHMNEVYFTVTADFVADYNASVVSPSYFAMNGSQGVPPHPADVYAITWSEWPLGSGGSWTEPRVYRSADELKYGETDIVHIDALAVSAQNGVIIFSTPINQQQGMLPQLLVFDPTLLGSKVVEMKDDAPGGAVPVTEKIDLPREGDIDAVCGYDPEGVYIDPVSGIPASSILENSLLAHLDEPMGFSAQRARPATGVQDGLHYHVTGWGDAIPQVCYMYVYTRTSASPVQPNADPLASPGWHVSAPILRLPYQDTMSFPVAAGYTPPSGQEVLEAFAVLVSLVAPVEGSETGGQTTPTFIAGSWMTQIEY